MAEASRDRRLRKDAQLNRARILDVARQAFTSARAEVSMDAIARQAGVGSGTLYRHFPNRDALLAALLDAHHDELERQRRLIETEERDAGRALDRWIDALGDWMLGYDGLSESLKAAWSRANSALAPSCHDAIATTDAFLSAAQKAGLARAELNGRGLFLGALAVAWASGAEQADANTRNVLRDMLKNGWSFSKDRTIPTHPPDSG